MVTNMQHPSERKHIYTSTEPLEIGLAWIYHSDRKHKQATSKELASS